jgi:muramoyltetrapeptide carboxypeptidase LdcA involved in peptidoglycan recycling
VGVTSPSSGVAARHGLGVPIIADVECGHVAPYLPIVNGALGRLQFTTGTGSLTQTLIP